MSLEPVLQVIPPRLRELLGAMSPSDAAGLEEIRIRQGRPMEVIVGGETRFVTDEPGWSNVPEKAVIASKEDCVRMLNRVSAYSLYALEEELRKGYVTVPGGHRIGLAGRVVVEGGKVRHLREITSFNVRIAREVHGAADRLLKVVMPGRELLSTLIVSPPQCGKTTLIRDLARMASRGGPGRPSRKVGIVDERSEIAGSFQGVPTFDVGPRTDVLDGCPKAEGMMMMIRSMSPEVLVVDELGGPEDCLAVREAVHAGVKLFVTAHGGSLEEIRGRPGLKELVEQKVFDRVVVLSRRHGPGTVESVHDKNLRPILTSANLRTGKSKR